MNQADRIFRIILICCILGISYGCSKKEDNSIIIQSKMNKRDNIIENTLKKQLEKGVYLYIYGAEVEVNDYNEEDMKACVLLAQNILKTNGYIQPSEKIFAEKIEQLFKRKIDFSSDKQYLYVNYFDICNKSLEYAPNNMIDHLGIYIIKKQTFLTEFYRIPELLDYQKEFPNIIDFENNISIEKDDPEYGKISISFWKNEEDIKERRNINLQTLVHRNKYLFNDNKASFAWLKFNDGYFLQSLVKVFGYDKDKELNAFVLRESLKNTEEFGKLLWNKPCGGKAQLNMGIIENITSLSDEEQKIYYKQVLDFLYQIRLGEVDLEISFSEQAEILGKLGYYLTKNAKETDFYFRINNEIKKTDGGYFPYEKEFEKNNYYNLPDFKKIWDDTKDGGMWDIRPQAQENDKSKVINENKVLPLYSRPDWNSFFQDIRVEEEIKYIHKVSGWDYVKIGDQLGYFPPVGEEKPIKKHSFLVEEEPLVKKEKGFWDKLFG